MRWPGRLIAALGLGTGLFGAALAAGALPGVDASPPALLLPVQGINANQLRDTFNQGRDGNHRGHEAIDILAPRGTPVLAADDGRIVKLFLNKPGGITC